MIAYSILGHPDYIVKEKTDKARQVSKEPPTQTQAQKSWGKKYEEIQKQQWITQ